MTTKLTMTKSMTTPSGERADFDVAAFLSSATVSQALGMSSSLFEGGNVPEPIMSSVHLLSEAIELPWETGFRDLLGVVALIDAGGGNGYDGGGRDGTLSGQALTSEEADRFASHVRRRMSMEPLQYILGKWDFRDLTLKVRAPCLCPRPETEELVDHAAAEVREALLRGKRYAATVREGGFKVRILDVGCGTGAIGLALASMFGPDDVEVVGIDVDPEAVDLSNENARDVLFGSEEQEGMKGTSRERWYRAILCSADDLTAARAEELNFEVVVSNPPYIPEPDMDGLTTDVVGYESWNALCGGKDGLDVVRDVVRRLPEWSTPGGCSCWMEVDTSHTSLIEKWLGPQAKTVAKKGDSMDRVEFLESVKDLSGRDRFVRLQVVPQGSGRDSI